MIVILIPIILFFRAIFGNLLVMTDTITDSIYLLEFMRQEILKGNFPFWNPYIFYGMPTIPTLQFGLYPFYILLLLLPSKFFVNYWVIFHLIFAGVGMFFLVNRIVNDRKIAFFGAISYTLSSIYFGYVYSGHLSKASIFSLLPFYFLYLREIFINPNIKNMVLLSLFTSLISLTSHIQMIYYLILFTIVYIAYELYFLLKKDYKKALKVVLLGF
ncbi:MAG: hypothetical protein ABIL37_06355, partial [candidate division WOR-3 bacterium]